ncbi:MAG TPA: hypothetical protein VKT99_05210 [Xanthobacteraceae bacterium]|jgi:hypothetical protein|nr:hypothetical protein [Xanthobacteraceae bacterium]
MNATRQTDIVTRLAARYDALRKSCSDLPRLELVAVRVKNEAPIAAGATPEEGAWARARDLAGTHAHAWIRRRSAVWVSDVDAKADLDDGSGGPPLWGEWASKDDSVHLRPDGSGQFRFHRIAETAHAGGQDVPAGARLLLRQEIAVIRKMKETAEEEEAGGARFRHERIKSVLLYHVYWGGTEGDLYGIRRLFSRFAGFDRRNVAINS